MRRAFEAKIHPAVAYWYRKQFYLHNFKIFWGFAPPHYSLFSLHSLGAASLAPAHSVQTTHFAHR